MALSSSNPLQLQPDNDAQPSTSSPRKHPPVWQDDQMFQLIDSILPFEACLYHQVLPLALKGTHLNLGMVNPSDSAALDYVRRILAYMNCSLVPEKIDAEKHQTALSAYLNYTGQMAQGGTGGAKREAPKQKEQVNRHEQATLIVDRPEILASSESITENAPEAAGSHVATPTAPLPLQKPYQPPAPPAPPKPTDIPVLEVKAQCLSSPVELLATLPPNRLLQELLGRILVGGIGRLYFERHPDKGRILWSQNGVLQSVLEDITPAVFAGTIVELKRMAQMSLIPVEKPKQIELERVYQNNRLLLRLRVMPGNHGEEATLQVLRGAALKFYQQQQIEHLGRDALMMAQQLQRKVNEIRDRTIRNPHAIAAQLEMLPALNQTIKNIEQQLVSLQQLATQHSPSDRS
jgi:Type II secretion system (T2SS), protein E, N-terminal domain